MHYVPRSRQSLLGHALKSSGFWELGTSSCDGLPPTASVRDPGYAVGITHAAEKLEMADKPMEVHRVGKSWGHRCVTGNTTVEIR